MSGNSRFNTATATTDGLNNVLALLIALKDAGSLQTITEDLIAKKAEIDRLISEHHAHLEKSYKQLDEDIKNSWAKHEEKVKLGNAKLEQDLAEAQKLCDEITGKAHLDAAGITERVTADRATWVTERAQIEAQIKESLAASKVQADELVLSGHALVQAQKDEAAAILENAKVEAAEIIAKANRLLSAAQEVSA